MNEKQYNDHTYTEKLSSGNTIAISPGSIKRFLQSSPFDNGTSFKLHAYPYKVEIFNDVSIFGTDISSQQHDALELTAYLCLDKEDELYDMVECLRLLLENPEAVHLCSQESNFEFINDSFNINIATANGHSYLAIPDEEQGTFRIINRGVVPISDSDEYALTRPSSFDVVDGQTQIIEFCRAVTEFIEIIAVATGKQAVTETAKKTTYEFRLNNYNKAANTTIDLTGSAPSLGRLAITAGEVPKTTMPVAEIVAKDDLPKLIDMIAGYDTIKAQLKMSLNMFQDPVTAERWGLQPTRGILLYGPPGTGKTALVEACANEIGATLQYITNDQVYGKYVGDSASNIAEIFDEAEQTKRPLVLAFDELDHIVKSSGNAGVDRSVVGILKQRLASLNNPLVLVMGTTNDLDSLDVALLRSGRFGEKLYIPVPQRVDRIAIFSKYIWDDLPKNIEATPENIDQSTVEDTFSIYDITDIKPEELADASDGFSGANIKAVLDRAKRTKASYEYQTKNKVAITHTDIMAAIAELRRERSVS